MFLLMLTLICYCCYMCNMTVYLLGMSYGHPWQPPWRGQRLLTRGSGHLTGLLIRDSSNNCGEKKYFCLFNILFSFLVLMVQAMSVQIFMQLRQHVRHPEGSSGHEEHTLPHEHPPTDSPPTQKQHADLADRLFESFSSCNIVSVLQNPTILATLSTNED